MEPQEPLKTTPPDTQNLNTDDRSLQKSDGSEPEGVYVVEEILGKRVINEQKFYLVHWKNYPEVQSTWEPIENLLNALDLVIEFEVRECLKECNQDSKDNEEDNDPLSQLKFQIPFNFTTENDVFIRLRTSDINPGYIGPMAMQIPRENGVTPMETSPTPKKKKKRMRQDSEHHIEVEPKEEKIKHKLKKVKITSSSNSFGGGKIIKLKRLQTTSLENITISTTEGIKKKRGRPPKSAQKDSSIILSQKSKEQIMISVENAKSDKLKVIKGMKGIKKYKKKDKAKSEEKIVDKGPEKAELVIKRPRGRPKLIKPTPSSIEKREVEISPEKSNSVIIPKKRGRPFKIKKDMTSSMDKKGDDETKMLKTDKNKTVVISKSMGDLDSGRSSSTKILLALKPTPGKKGKSKDKIKMEVSISPEKGGKNVSPEKGPDGQVKRKRGRPPGKKNANKEVEKEKEKEKIVIQPVSISMPLLPQKKLVKSLSSSSIELNRDALKDKSGVPVLVPKKRGRPPKYLKETSAKGKMEVEGKPEKVKSKMSVSQPKSTARSGMEVESSTDR